VVAVRAWPVPLLVSVTVTLGIDAPDGSFIIPVRPDVPDDWAINDGTHSANKTAMNCKQKNLFNVIDSLF
jgi:hypothetical protein